MDRRPDEGYQHETLVLLTAVSLPWRVQLPEGLFDRDLETRGRDKRIYEDANVIDTHRVLAPFIASNSESVQSDGIVALRTSLTAFGFAGFAVTTSRDEPMQTLEDAFAVVVRDRLTTLNQPPHGISIVESDFSLIQGEIPWIHRVTLDSASAQAESLQVGLGQSRGRVNGTDMTDDHATISRWMDILSLSLCFWSQQEALDSEIFLRIARMNRSQDRNVSLAGQSTWIESVTTVPLAMTSIEQNLPRDLQEIWLNAMEAWRMPELMAAVRDKVDLYKNVIVNRQARLREGRERVANVILAVIGASTLGFFIETLVNQATTAESFGFQDTHYTRWLLITIILLVVAVGVRQIMKKDAEISGP